MNDKTVVARVRRQRNLRITEGWHEVKVWVPTESDAEDIRKLAAERRAKAEKLDGLSREVPKVTSETEMRIARAIAEHGSAAYRSPSGAVLDLLTELANEDDLQGFSRAFVILARAKPGNATFVSASVPAKISNFLIQRRGISSQAFLNWTASRPGWRSELEEAVRDPARFERVVEDMAVAIRARRKKR